MGPDLVAEGLAIRLADQINDLTWSADTTGSTLYVGEIAYPDDRPLDTITIISIPPSEVAEAGIGMISYGYQLDALGGGRLGAAGLAHDAYMALHGWSGTVTVDGEALEIGPVFAQSAPTAEAEDVEGRRMWTFPVDVWLTV